MMLSIIIPVFNEEKSIGRLLYNLKECHIPTEYEIIVVDDNSEDVTRDIVLNEHRQNRKISLISRKGKRGLGRSLKEGFANAKGDIIVVLMGDLSDNINDIPEMLKKICDEGYDFVCASRYIEGGIGKQKDPLKEFFSKFLSKAIYLFVKIPTLDSTNTYKMFRRNVLEEIGPLASNRYTLCFELLLKAYKKGFKIVEIPTLWRDRENGKSHFQFLRDGIQYLRWLVFALVGK